MGDVAPRPAGTGATLAAGTFAIVAGGGALPHELAERLTTRGITPVLITIRGFATPATRLKASATIDITDVEGLMRALAASGARDVMLVGGVTRPSPSALLGLAAAARNRAQLAQILDPLAGAGDDGLLRGVIGYIERHGYAVRGLPEIAPELLAPEGEINGAAIPPEADEAIATGRNLLATLSPFDVGQGVVVRGRRVLAIEGPEGTDRMLRRARRIGRRGWFRAPEPGGVLVKLPKRGQDMRVDLPAIGPRTIAHAGAAGLAGIVIAAGQTLILDREATRAAARRAGLFVVGIRMDGAEPC